MSMSDGEREDALANAPDFPDNLTQEELDRWEKESRPFKPKWWSRWDPFQRASGGIASRYEDRCDSTRTWSDKFKRLFR